MFDKLIAFANNLTENLNERGLYCEIKTIGKTNIIPRPDDGVYIIFGKVDHDILPSL